MSGQCEGCGANVSDSDAVCSFRGMKNQAYRQVDNDVNYLLEEAMAAYQNEQYAMAINYYNQSIALDPSVADAYFYLAASYTVLKRYEEAIKAMEKAKELRPGSAPIFFNLGMLHKLSGRKAEARKNYEMALALFKKEPSSNKGFLKNIEKEIGELKRWKLF